MIVFPKTMPAECLIEGWVLSDCAYDGTIVQMWFSDGAADPRVTIGGDQRQLVRLLDLDWNPDDDDAGEYHCAMIGREVKEDIGAVIAKCIFIKLTSDEIAEVDAAPDGAFTVRDLCLRKMMDRQFDLIRSANTPRKN